MNAATRTSGSAPGSMKPEWLSTQTVRRVTGTREAKFSAGPLRRASRAIATARGRRSRVGMRSGAPIVVKVPPGIPATASSPATRSGWRCATSNPTSTPYDQPAIRARSTPRASMRATRSSAWSRIRTRAGSAGRAEPKVPRWYQVSIEWSLSAWLSDGHICGTVPRPGLTISGGPAPSLHQPRNRVPSALTNSKVLGTACSLSPTVES